MIADEDAVNHIPKNPPQFDRGHVLVLMVLLLALKLVQGGVHHTCGGGYDIACTPAPLLSSGAGDLNFLLNFLKGGGFDQISIFRRSLLGKRG